MSALLRRVFGISLFHTACWLVASGDASAAEVGKQPNVIVIMTDDQGYGDMACHGHPFVKTPNLDRLHRESLRLTDFHVMPLCSPTRAALMTGRDPMRDGIWATVLGRSILPASTPTMGDVFKAAGYRTAMIGKWHLGDNAPARPQDKGFRHVFMHGGGGVGQTPDHWGNDYVDDLYDLDGEPVRTMGYCTDVWFGDAIRFVRESKDRPFFLYLATNAPHAPFVPPPASATAYRDVPGIDPQTAAFYSMIENVDANVGKLLDELDKTGLARETIVVFLNDNGTARGQIAPGAFNAGMRGVKGTLYDGGHRAACFIRWPGGGSAFGGGKDISGLTIAQDLLPTLASLCGIDLAKHPVPLDGLDLGPVLRGEKAIPDDRRAFVQFSQTDAPPVRGKAAVLSNRWRLIEGKQLFDMQADPGQAKNVAAEHAEVVASLNAAYDRWFEGLGEALKRENPIHIGGAEAETWLNVMDLHTGGTPANLPWHQGMILKGQKVRGYWAVEAKKAGTYRFRCARWPAESGMKLTDAPASGTAWPIAKARLKIGEIERTIEVLPGDTYAEFEVELKTGQSRLQADFLDGEGREIGSAFYVGIKKR